MRDVEETRFTDQIDAANHIAEKYNSSLVAAARLKSAPEQVQNPDGTWPVTECNDCGEDLEPHRLAHARIRCVPCQTYKEKQEMGYGRV